MKTRINLIDGNSFLFRAFYGIKGKLTRSDGTPVNAVYGLCTMLLNLLSSANPDEQFYMVFDAARKNFRNDIYPEYKANRTELPDDLIPQIALSRLAVTAFDIPILEINGFEADDIIATMVKHECFIDRTVRVVTSDKDLMQLVDPCCYLYDSMKELDIHEAQVLEKFGVRPDQVIDIQSLIGDSSDNVPGVPGIGPKTAAELINEFETLDNLYNHLDDIKNERRRELLRNNHEMALMSRQLVTLRNDVPLPEFPNKPYIPNANKIATFFKNEMESPALISKLEKWLGKTEFVETNEIKFEPKSEPKKHNNYKLITTEKQLNEFISEIEKHPIIAIDTETTGLNSMDDRLVGISISCAPHSGCYIPIRHGGQRDLLSNEIHEQLDIDTVYKKLWPILTNQKIIKVGQNIKYDFHMFENEGWDTDQITPIDDTMLLSYALFGSEHLHNMDTLAQIYLKHQNIKFSDLFDEKTKNPQFGHLHPERALHYAAEDADITLRLYQLFRPKLDTEIRLKKLYENCDLPLIRVLLHMERNGVHIDTNRLAILSEKLHKKMNELESEIYQLAGSEFNIASPSQIGFVLFEKLGIPYDGKKTKTGSYSTDAAMLEEIATLHPIIPLILEWRTLSKLTGTYTDALPNAINKKTGRIHTSYLQTSTNTGRLSSRDPNLQNIPIRGELGPEIRACFTATDGNVLIAADYSQIQLRLLAQVADIPSLKQIFRNGKDIHTMTAHQIFNVPESDVTSDQRRVAKTVNFSIVYGISAFGLASQLKIERHAAQQLIDSYFTAFPEIKIYMDKIKDFAREHAYVMTPWGRKIVLNDMKNSRTRAYGLRAAINAPIQGFEADLMRLALCKTESELKKSYPNAKLLMQVHDEMVFEAPNQDAESVAKIIRDTMEHIAELSIPLVAETGIGPDWNSIK